MRRAILALLPALLAAPAAAPAQATFSTGIKVVSVFATVRDKRGAFVRDLTKDDFSVSENGRPQTIRYFSRDTDLPLTLGLMIDTSLSQRRVMDAERIAFLDEVVREKKDQVFVMQFDLSPILRQGLTSSLRTLYDALQRVDTPSTYDLMSQTGGGTMLYDALLKASHEIMRDQPGERKALIVLSDGVDTGSEATRTEAIEAAQRSGTLIYTIDFSDATYYGGFGGGNGRGVLVSLARDTGGGFFEVTRKQSLDDIFQQLQEELRSQYDIGYVSDQPVDVSEFRKIQLTTDRKGVVVQARNRYWAQR